MLKVLHTGDWHIGSFPGPEVNGQNARFQDICRCLDFQAMYAEEHRPDLIVVSGDIFHQARVWSDRGLRESRTAIDHIRRLSNVAPTVVLRGTPNHDSEEQFEMLVTTFYGDDSVSVVTEPEVLHIHTYHGQRVDVACVPGFDRGVHRAAHPGLSREEETQVFTDELAKVVLGLKAQCEPGVTSILSTHFTVPGCNMESGQTALFAQFEPVIYPATLKAADFDLVALGHIHRPQQLPEAGRAVFYCGSMTVTEKLDGKTTKTRTGVASGTALTFEQTASAAGFQKILNGNHTITVEVSDGKETVSTSATFTKAVHAASVTLAEPLAVEGDITVAVLQVTGSIPDDAKFKAEVTNNALDSSPVWQDATTEVKKGVNIVFENKTATNGAAFNFRVSVERGESGEGGYIEAVSGAFQ